MLTTERHLKPIEIFINAKIILPDSKGNDNAESISLNINQTLNGQLKSFFLKKNIKLNKEYYLYLIKGNDILKSLPKNTTVKKLNLHYNDIILVSYEKKQIKNQLKSSNSNKLPSEGSISYDEKLTEKFDKQNPIIHISKKSVEINDNQKEMKKKILR
jgi:nicotinic acid mononucleotide adenylyltransferase